MIFYLWACTEMQEQITQPEVQGEVLIVVSAALDYSVGSLAYVDVAEQTLHDDVASVSGDAVLVLDRYLWQLNRYQYDTIRKYDPAELSAPLQEISVAPEIGSANPHDVVICDERLFVSLYEQTNLAVYDISGLSLLETIDISAFADADGITEASSMVVIDDKAYVALQGLDRVQGFRSVGSTLLEIDCASSEIHRSWEFGENIHLEKDEDANRLLVATRAFEGQDGSRPAGVYTFTPTNGDFLPLETMLDRQVEAMYIQGQQLALITAALDYSAYYLECVDIAGGSRRQSAPKIEFLTDVGIDEDGAIWVSAHWGWNNIEEAQPGLYMTDMQSCTLEEPQFSLSLAPMSMVFFGAE